MITLFNEEVNATSTNSVHNTLYVESFEEVFFGVYEFELNGSAVIAEEVAKYEGEPVVTIPVVDNGNKYEAPFILRKGLHKVEFNTANTVFVEKVIEEPDLNTVMETVKQSVGDNNNVNITYNVDKDDIIKELKESLEADRVSIIESLRDENSNTLAQIENIRDSIFIEFTTNSDNYREKESKDLKQYIENKLNDICHENNILVESSLQGDAKFASERDINRALSRVGSVKKELEDSKREITKTIALAEERIKKHYAVKIREVEEAAVNNIRKEEILKVVTDSKAKILAELNNSHGLKKQLRFIAEEASNGLYDPVSSKRFQETVKRDLAKNFSAEMQQIKRMVASYGGGGGTNAVQYARGGVMNGNLNVEGTILSGGTDISSLFGSGGGGGGSNLEILDEGSSLTSTASAINFVGAGVTATNVGAVQTVTINTVGGGGGSDVTALSANWEGTYTTVATSSANWEGTSTTVAANSAAWAIGSGGTVTAVTGGDGIDSSGGTTPELTVDATVVRTSGDQTIGGTKTFTGSTTIQGNLSVQGDLTSIDTIVSVTSALSVTNHGTGPAIYAEQTGVGQPIAKFVDTEGGVIVFDDGGKLGIGTTAPAQSLDVIGKIAVCGVTAVYIPHLSANYTGSSFYGDGGSLMSGFLSYHSINNTGVGVGALYNNLQGANNTAVGTDALASNTYGYHNAATGYAALSANTLGCYNTADGSYTLGSNTTGLRNTATGYAALSTNTTGCNNTALGEKALTRNLNGHNNTAIGNCALFCNFSGDYNIGIGGSALRTNTADCNIGIGINALGTTTGGGCNIAIGHCALLINTGCRNTAVGTAALSNNQGFNNTAIGEGALGNKAVGNWNVAAGWYAGAYLADGTTANTTSHNSIYIGADTRASAGAASNETVIGNCAVGYGTNTVTIGSSAVTTTVLQGNVGIGTADAPVFAPAEALTVSGNISASGTVRSTNIDTLTNNVSALYSYLVQNFESNTITVATSISDFVTSYSKAGIVTGDVVTISATNQVYILGDSDGNDLSDWLEVNLKPNLLFYKQGLVDYSVVDTLPLSSVNSTKYIVEVQDKSDGAIFYGEINVVSDGSIAVATEYALNHTTIFPFVEFGAEVVSGTHIQLSAVALEGTDMSDFVFKGNRSNLFG